MTEFDVVAIGSMNMDIAGRSLDRLLLADSNPGIITHAAGGVGRNIAHNLTLLAKKTALISVMGDDLYGQNLRAQAQEIGLDVSHCLVMEGESSPVYLALLDEAGEMIAAINDMAILERLTPDFFAPLMNFLKQARALVIDCNLPQQTIELLLSSPDLPPVFVDAVSSIKVMRIKNLLAFIHTFKPNRLEAEALSGIRIDNKDDMTKVANWFHAQGLKNLVISDGQGGLYHSQAEGAAGWVDAIDTEIVNVSGAGDACVAGLVCGWLEGWDLQKSSRFAQSCAAITLECEMTNNPHLTFTHAVNIMEEAYGPD